jgi:TonB family protein
MFSTLPESRPGTERSFLQALASLTFHAGLIMGAVHVTRGAATMVERRLADTSAIYVQPMATTPPVAAHTAPAAAPSTAEQPVFTTIAPPAEIPVGIPSIDLGQTVDPSRFTALGTGAPGSTLGPAVNGVGDPPHVGRDFTLEEVDVPVSYLGGGEPVYPTALKQAGLSGSVTLQFVVDTAGRVEPASVKVMPRSTAGFESAAREAILRARFSPAGVRGRVVRQLVQQRVLFEMGR